MLNYEKSFRISGTHYLTAQAPAAALMSDDEDDVKKTMLKVAKPDATPTGNTDTGSNNEVAIHEGYAVSGGDFYWDVIW